MKRYEKTEEEKTCVFILLLIFIQPKTINFEKISNLRKLRKPGKTQENMTGHGKTEEENMRKLKLE